MAPEAIENMQFADGNDGVDGPAQTASSAKAAAFRAATGGPSMDKLSRIGVDLGKGYFQVHCLPLEGGPAMNRKLSRPKMRAFFAGIARVGLAWRLAARPIIGRA